MKRNFRGVIPILPVRDVDATLHYYRDVLGYGIAGRHLNEAGEVVFGSVLCGQANFYLAKTNETIAPNHGCVWVEEVDELCREFRAKGAKIVDEVSNKPWGYRQFTVEDLNGHQMAYFRFLEPGE